MRTPHLRVFLVAGLSLPVATIGACQHQGGESNPDGGESACTASATLPPVQAVLTSRCAGSSCHSSGPGGMFPPLAEGDPSEWVTLASHESPGMQLVVPGHPEQSYLYMKVSGTQGPSGGALMPLGASMPIPEADDIHDWIAAGAPGSCSGGDAGAPPPMAASDPNALDQGQLFTCPSGGPPTSSPARLRRIDSPEWTYALPQALNGLHGNGYTDTGYLNPFTALATEPYSTYASGVNVDTATLDLYFQNLPIVPGSWGAGNGIGLDFNGDPGLGCMFGGAALATPTDACIDNFVDKFLTLGVLARTPTSAEHANLRALLVTTLATEGGDLTKRAATLALVEQAAWLTSGALFRSEMGSSTTDPGGRTRLTNEELGLTVGAMLSYHRPGAPMINVQAYGSFKGPAAPDDECHPWLHLVSEAVANGTIQDPATIKSLVTAYGGGVDPGGQPMPCQSGVLTPRRRDLSLEVIGTTRGEYWLSPRIAGFFREWLGYGAANTVFKDEPGLTSRFWTTSDQQYWTTQGYSTLQGPFAGHESTLLDQMDDTVARTVLDAATNKVDVFKALMTTTTFHVASDRADTNGHACTTNADCATPYPSCVTEYGLCYDTISGGTIGATRVYNVEDVPATDAGRWVTLPATERSGVLTHPAWLSSIGDNFQDDPSLIHRGKWVRQNLFCETVPGLELVMVAAKLGVRSPTLSARDRVSAAIDPNPTCLGCHHLMNTLGYPFEMYDAAGFLRKYDKLDAEGKTEHAPDATSTITNAPDPALNGAVANAVELTQKLSNSPYARRCFIRQAFRYFMGRDETMADQCTLASMESALDTGSFFDMLAVLASSDTVLYRTTMGGQP